MYDSHATYHKSAVLVINLITSVQISPWVGISPSLNAHILIHLYGST